ncbi:oligosaccharide flippase family protein [Telmatobacter sp. DSM 110680]|uniref:Oligosaccharide flippase family protein n=1 Tax=Telmatobacter sp. DSM 110680 TaxID=3036704 RepID=A0AAU7DFK8_9BACT
MKNYDKSGSTGRKLLMGSIFRIANLAGAVASSLFLMPLIVHHLGDRVYGFWSLAWTFIGYYGLLDFGLSSAVSQYLSIAIGRKDEAESQAVFNTALRLQSILGVVALAITVGLAAATPLLCHDPNDAAFFWKVIVVLGINAAISFPVRVYTGILESELRFDVQSGLDFLGLVLRTGLITWAVLSGGGLLALALASLVGAIPIVVLQVALARRESPWARISRTPFDRKRSKAFLSYSIYTFIATSADTLRYQLDPLVISAFIGLVAVTHYRIAGVFARYYVEALLALMRLFQPLLSRHHGAGDDEAVERVFYFATKVTLSVSVFICAVVIAYGKPFIALWMGVKYQDAYPAMVVLSIAVFLDVCQSPSVGLLYSTFNHKYYTYMNLAEGLLNLAFSIALVRPMGILGVATGTLAGALAIRVVVQPIVVCKSSHISYPVYVRFLAGNILRFGVLMGVSLLILASHSVSSYTWLVGLVSVTTSVYAAGCWIFGFSGSERGQVTKAISYRRQNRFTPITPAAAEE